MTSAAREANARKGRDLLFQHLAIIQDNRRERNQKTTPKPEGVGEERTTQEEKESAIPKHRTVMQPNQTVMIHGPVFTLRFSYNEQRNHRNVEPRSPLSPLLKNGEDDL